MIVIKDKEFEMVQVKTSPFFNLSMLTTINAGKDTERQEMKIISYGIPFETCIQHIVSHRMSEIDDEFTASQYIEKYKSVVNEVCKLITHIEPGKDDIEIISEKDDDVS